jgi:electron transfer flavoprotein beta subunit
MKILVAIKQVVALDDDFELEEGAAAIDDDYVDRSLNEWDAFALEAAVQLVEHADGEVVVVTVGDEETDEALRACLARGAQRALRIDVGGLDALDSLSVGRILAAVADREAPDLLLVGVQSSDEASGATGAATAGYLEWPRVAVVNALTPDGDGMRVDRELEGGVVERLRVRTPCLLTVQTGTNEPRYASLRALKQAAAKPLDVLTPGDVGVSAEGLSAVPTARTRALRREDTANHAVMLGDDASAVAGRIVEIVKERLSA